jgi:hypothetical protein
MSSLPDACQSSDDCSDSEALSLPYITEVIQCGIERNERNVAQRLMKKLLIFMSVLAFTDIARCEYNFADIVKKTDQVEPSASDQPAKKEQAPEPAKLMEKKTPETALTYVRAGKSMTFEDSGRANYLVSVGHRRLADSFIYGGEYSFHYVSATRYSDYDMLLGYRPAWSHKVVPFGVIGGGLSFQYNRGDDGKNHVSRSGINYFADVGTEFYSYDFGSFNMKMLSGIRVATDVLAGEPNKVTFGDFYLSVGFGW